MFGVYWVSSDSQIWRERHCYLFTDLMLVLIEMTPLLQKASGGSQKKVKYCLEGIIDSRYMADVTSDTGKIQI